jgi:hypothetical protein
MVKCYTRICRKRGYNKDMTGVLLCDECCVKKNIEIKVEFKNKDLSGISEEDLYKMSTSSKIAFFTRPIKEP